MPYTVGSLKFIQAMSIKCEYSFKNLLEQHLSFQMNVHFFKVIIYYNDTAIA